MEIRKRIKGNTWLDRQMDGWKAVKEARRASVIKHAHSSLKLRVKRGKQAQEASVESPACNLAQTTQQSIYADIKPKPTKVTGSHNQNQSQLTIQAVRQSLYTWAIHNYVTPRIHQRLNTC